MKVSKSKIKPLHVAMEGKESYGILNGMTDIMMDGAHVVKGMFKNSNTTRNIVRNVVKD